MSSGKVLICESTSINGVSSLSSLVGDVSTLNNKSIDDTMKFRVEVTEFDVVCLAILSSAEPSKILGSLRGEIIKELEGNSASSRCPDLHIHVDFRIDF